MKRPDKLTILSNKFYNSPSVFLPENLLRDARRQKNMDSCPVPAICVLDPDGDLVSYLNEKMEAAALYALGMAKQKGIICFAHLTNTMSQNEGDFEKGEHFGSIHTLELLEMVIKNSDQIVH